MVRYNNELDEYESYHHYEAPFPSSSLSSRSSHTNNKFHGIPKELLPFLGHAASSAVGSALANFATYPFELVSTRLKVQRQVISQRQRITRDRRRITKEKRRSQSSSSSSSSGVQKDSSSSSSAASKRIGGAIEERETKDGIRIKKWEEHDGDDMRVTWETEYDEDDLYEGHFDAFSKIYEKEGIGGFYHGIGWDTIGQVTNGLWYFAIYNLLRHHRRSMSDYGLKNKNLPILEELGIGIAAAAVSKFVSSPFSTIVTRKQTAALLYPNARAPSVVDIHHDIMREHGISGFWSGYSASLLLTLNPSITFLLYELIKPHAIEHRGHLDAIDAFLLAAACKALASTLTYPLVVVRTRAQLEGDDRDAEVEDPFEGGVERGRSGRRRRKKVAVIRKAKGIVDILVEVIKREGISALYVGIGGELMKGFLSGGVSTMIKQTVHTLILRLYFFVLNAYNSLEEKNYSNRVNLHRKDIYKKIAPMQNKLIEKGIVSDRRAIRGTREREMSSRLGLSEKAHLGQYTHSAGHYRNLSGEKFEDFATVGEERKLEDRNWNEAPAQGRSEEILEENIFLAPNPNSYEASAHGETIEINESHRSKTKHHLGDEHRLPAREVVRSDPPSREISERVIVKTSKEVPVGDRRTSSAAPRTIARVEKWMDKVEKDTLSSAKDHASSLTPSVDFSASANMGAEFMTSIPHISTEISTRHFPIRDPSIASGNSYRAPSGRTSLIVNPSSSIYERRDRGNESRVERLHGSRFGVDGDIGIGGHVKGVGSTTQPSQRRDQDISKIYK